MINNQRILAVITARGGSKGLPGKNIRPLGGKPLIGWTIEAAKQARSVDRLIVTSDSNEILDVARRFGADTPFIRPAELAGDLSKQEDALLHAMNWVENEEGAYDFVMLLAPTNPLRSAADIDSVAEYLVGHARARSVMTVVPCDHSPLQANVLPPDRSMKDFMPPELRLKNRQELPQYYRICGSVCISEWDYFKEQGSFLTPLSFAYVTTARSGLDIDHLTDFLLAEVFLTKEE